MFSPEFVCELPVFAASGLVINSGTFYIVSDDEVSLVHGTPGDGFEVLNLWDEILPEDPAERKKVKPDFECLYLDGQKLFLIPSLSRKNRTRGGCVELGTRGEILRHELKDYSTLREKLEKIIPDLNIEGALVKKGMLHLFQRGNGKRGRNSIIIGEDFQVRDLELPHHRDIPLTVTDATLRGNTIWFTAVAEDTESTYLDGEVVGSFLGTLDDDLKLISLRELKFSGKPEGLAFSEDGRLYFVTDDDSREKPSRLFLIRDY